MIRNTPTASCWCLLFYSLKDEYDESCHGGKGAGQGVCVASAARRGPECISRPGLYADARRVPGFAWPFGRGQVDLAAHPLRLLFACGRQHKDTARRGNAGTGEVGKAHLCTPVTNEHIVCR